MNEENINISEINNNENNNKNNKKKMKKSIKAIIITSSILGFIFIFLLTINLIPPKRVLDFNPFISTSSLPMICAHRGGSISNPENTLKT